MAQMTNERKAELFDRAMNWVYEHLVYADKAEYEENLENIGFTNDEIAEVLKEVFDDEEEV